MLPNTRNTHRNYVRTARKRCGLTQEDLAFLLACADGKLVSRYERGVQTPSLKSALACQVALGVPVHELFGGIYEEVEHIIHNQAHVLIEHPTAIASHRNAKQKRAFLRTLVSRLQHAPHNT